MKELSNEKNKNNKELMFTIDDTTTIIFETIKQMKTGNKFRYLYQSYQRIKTNPLSKAIDINEICNNITTYFSILYLNPECFDVVVTQTTEKIEMPKSAFDLSSNQFASNEQDIISLLSLRSRVQEQLKSKEETFTTIENDFYAAFIEDGVISSDSIFSYAVMNECKNEMFDLVIRKSYCQLNNLNQLKTLDKMKKILESYNSLLSYEGFGEVFINHKYFLPEKKNLNGKQFQYSTIFGRMFSVTVWPTENPQAFYDYFISIIDPNKRKNIVNTISDQFNSFYTTFYSFIKDLLKNKETKDNTIMWFRTLINLNKDYFKMKPNYDTLSSKGLFINWLSLFLEFCDPFSSKPSKYYETFEKINTHYWATDKYLSLTKIDKICGDELEEVKADDEDFNFVTEWFFITHVLINLSFKKVIKAYDTESLIVALALKLGSLSLIDKVTWSINSMDSHLLAKNFSTKLLQFLSFSSVYFWYENSKDKEKTRKILPFMLPSKIEIDESTKLNPELSHIYELFWENITKIGLLYRIHLPSVFENSFTFQSLMMFALFITRTKVLLNPYLRAKTLNFICEFSPKYLLFKLNPHEEKWKDLLLNNKLCQNYLLKTLIYLYEDVEKTGSSLQFFEKYHYRLLISNTITFLLKDKFYKQQIDSIATENEVVFEKFAHFMISDFNELFKTSLSKLETIKSKSWPLFFIEYEDAKANWNKLTREERTDYELNFTIDSKDWKVGMQLSRVTLKLCILITKTGLCREAFMSDANLSHFVEGLNYALDMMTSK